EHAWSTVAGDEVAGPGCRAANQVVRSADGHSGLVAQGLGAGDIGADEVALHDVAVVSDLDGISVDVYEEHFWELRPVRFEYLYVGLPGLDAVQYVQGDNWLGVALAALMRLHGGPAPVRHFLPELIDLVWNGKMDPGKVFDLTLPLDQVAEGYHAMDERR